MQDHERATFNGSELAVVLSHYDLGIIESITDFDRGSRQSPKAGIVSARGKFLLKRLAPQRADGDRVRFAHRVQRCLESAGFPTPKLIETRDRLHTFVQTRTHIYELFTFIPGHAYRQTTEEIGDAGVLLARFHEATSELTASTTVAEPRGDYHDSPGVRTGLCAIASSLATHESFCGDEKELPALTDFLLKAYDAAAEAANQLGFAELPIRLTHSDWHPGNLLFRKQRVAGVVDFDSVRWSRVVADVANGVLQFSMLSGGDPSTWPEYADEDRWAAFTTSYETVHALSDTEHRCIPHLMSEALIAECVPPIAQTGSVGPWTGYRVLQMVRRKVEWLAANHERLARVVAT